MSDLASALRVEEPVVAGALPASLPAAAAVVPAAVVVVPARGDADESAPPLVAPATPQERIESIDVLRGVSVLGILLININSFGLPFAAYTDPSTYGGASGANFVVWLVNHVLFEGKMRAIFSMLFGASVVILTSRAERRGGGVEIADVYYRRTLWLIAIGVLHAYFIWYGDILFFYGVVGLALFPFRKLSARTLCILGVLLLCVHAVQGVRGIHKAERAARTIAEIETIERAGQALTANQQEQLNSAREQREYFKPDARTIAAEIETTRGGGYIENLKARSHVTASLQSDVFYRYLIWDIAGMLLLGMGLMKLGVFDASRSVRFYVFMAIVGYGVGVPLATVLSLRWAHSGFDVTAMFRYIRAPDDIVRFSVAAGHIAVVMLICKSGVLPATRRALAKVGRMALTNYLLMSVLCTLLFYGYGLGMFAELERFELLYVVVIVWGVNVIVSMIWLTYFRFGPIEWAWRSLTYAKVQPMWLPNQPAATAVAASAR